MRVNRYEGLTEQIKNGLDIVEVVGRYVQLKRAGSNYKGLCPFHNEKTPSFLVSPEKQIFNCFGCGVGGDVIGFVQRMENLDFVETLERLADELGIEIQRSSGAADQKRESMYDISKHAARHFYKNLRKGDNPGLRYVVRRGISPETAAKFGIGFARDAWQDMSDFLKEKGLSEEICVELGLLSKNKRNEDYDKFRNRVIFPIINTRDKVIGFGGRAIDDSMPKYLNSPESLIFKKKDNLYGLNLAKNSIRKSKIAILVEGYMDVVSLADAGVENVVATLGTALTQEQAKLLKKYTETVVLSYDSDGAGQTATFRGIDILQSAGLRVKVLQLSEGKDPDEFVRKNGKDAFNKLVDESISFMEYKINSIKKKFDMNTTDGSIRFLEEISVELRKISSPAEQAAYIKQIAEITKIPESSLRREVESQKGKPPIIRKENPDDDNGEKNNKIRIPPNPKKTIVSKTMIKLMLANAKYIPVIADKTEMSDYFYGSGYEGIWEAFQSNYTEDTEINTDDILEILDDEDKKLLNDVINNILPVIDEEDTLIQCGKTIKIQNLKARRKEILKFMEVLDEDKDKEKLEKLTSEIMELDKLLKKTKE